MNNLFALPSPQIGGDVAYTPAAVARACVCQIRALCPEETALAPWWEPCAGGGAFVRALAELGHGAATELDPEAASVRAGLAVQGDALGGPPSGLNPVMICTNPPFSDATAILKMALAVPSCRVVALLLLQSWIVCEGKGPEYRTPWVWGPEATLYSQSVLYPRIAFEGPGRSGKETDQRDYALCIWRRTPDGSWCWGPGPVLLHRLVWRRK